jgi:subtilisin family serine protease
MKSLRLFALAGVAMLAACADTPVQPEITAVEASRGRAAVVADAGGRYIIEFNGAPARAFAGRVAALGGSVESMHDAGIAIVSGLDSKQASQLGRIPGVAAVLPDVRMSVAPTAIAQQRLDAAAGVADQSQANPAGSILYAWQWNLHAVSAPTAWSAGRLGDPDVAVAILDTGLDYDNRDLRTLVDLDRSVSFSPIDDDTLLHYFGPGWHPVTDLNGHGTNVAAQVSSVAFAFAGVTSRTTLIGVKVLDQNGHGDFSGLLLGVLHAVDVGADVLNLSLSVPGGLPRQQGGSYISLINRVFNYAFQNGSLVVVAAGNDAADMDHDGPTLRAVCQAPNVVCVSATGPASSADIFVGPWNDIDAFAPYSNFGRSSVSVAGPGGNAGGYVWSFCARHALWPFGVGASPKFPCVGGGTLVGMAGTSQASPHVAGIAALIVAEQGKGNPARVRHALISSADDLGQPGTDPQYGRGRVNAARALGLH